MEGLRNRAGRGGRGGRRGRGVDPIPAPAQAPVPVDPPLPVQIPIPQVQVPLARPPKPKDPPTFRGSPEEDVVNWMFRFEQIADYNQWTPEQRLRLIGMSFEGSAQKWYCGLMLRIPPPDTFDALRTELFRAFKPVNYEAHLESRLRSRKQENNESFTDYFHDVLYLCSRLEPRMEDRVKIQHLFRGLPPSSVRGIFRFIHPLSTTDDFFREVQLFLQGEEMAARQELSTVPRSPLFTFQEGNSAPPSTYERNQPSPSFVSREDFESFEQRQIKNTNKVVDLTDQTDTVSAAHWGEGRERHLSGRQILSCATRSTCVAYDEKLLVVCSVCYVWCFMIGSIIL